MSNEEFEDKIRMGVAVNLAWSEWLNISNQEEKQNPDYELITQKAFEIKKKYLDNTWGEYNYRKEEDNQKKLVDEAKKELIL